MIGSPEENELARPGVDEIEKDVVRAKWIKGVAAGLLVLSGTAWGAEDAAEVSAVPEPSALLLAGLCGLLFLFWRRK